MNKPSNQVNQNQRNTPNSPRSVRRIIIRDKSPNIVQYSRKTSSILKGNTHIPETKISPKVIKKSIDVNSEQPGKLKLYI